MGSILYMKLAFEYDIVRHKATDLIWAVAYLSWHLCDTAPLPPQSCHVMRGECWGWYVVLSNNAADTGLQIKLQAHAMNTKKGIEQCHGALATQCEDYSICVEISLRRYLFWGQVGKTCLKTPKNAMRMPQFAPKIISGTIDLWNRTERWRSCHTTIPSISSCYDLWPLVMAFQSIQVQKWYLTKQEQKN